MDYDFDTVVPRRGSGSYKWDSSEHPDSLPMWVADMDFKTAPAVIEALERRVRHGVFGYTKVPEAYYDSVRAWYSRRYDFEVEREWLLYTPGVVPAISAILRGLTKPGDGVVIQTPVYNCFFSSIRNLECRTVESPLINQGGRFKMDFEDLESKVADPGVKIMLLCNPHNPVGRCWTADELRRVGEICFRHDVIVVSDEIHCDLVFPGFKHQPFASLGEEFLKRSISCHSPSKSFNIAGLQIANLVVADPELRERVDRGINIHEVCDVNPFGVEACMAAYNDGEAWLDALRAYLYENYQVVSDFITKELPMLSLTQEEATYLAWIDCRKLGRSSTEFAEQLKERAKLLVSEGRTYGDDGDGFIRLNMACPRSVLVEGLQRMKSVLSGK